MHLLPSIERTTRDATFSHFLLMFGYKLFSFYFPLFLLQKGLSVPEVGYTFLLIYLPIALSAPLVGILNHKFNPALLVSLGIAGYGAYSLAMLMTQGLVLFYLAQVLLGVSAALFFVSSRAIIMGFKPKRPDRSFGWFYTAPFYTDALAPAFGALIIWQFGFAGVFVASLGIHAFNMVFTFLRMHDRTESLRDHLKIPEMLSHYKMFFGAWRHNTAGPLFLVVFIALATGGFYHAFFVLFLKELGWSQNQVLLFGSLSAALFVPLSLLAIRFLGRQPSTKNIVQGLLLYSFSGLLFGVFGKALNFASALLFLLIKDVGSFVANSGRSGKITRSFSSHPEEAGAIDTMFSPLGQSVGFLAGGLLIGAVGYPFLFIGGALAVFVPLLAFGIAKKGNLG